MNERKIERDIVRVMNRLIALAPAKGHTTVAAIVISRRKPEDTVKLLHTVVMPQL